MDKPNASTGAPLRKAVAGNTVHQRGVREVPSVMTVIPKSYLTDPSTDWNSESLGKKKGATFLVQDGDGTLSLATARGSDRNDPWDFSLSAPPADGTYMMDMGAWRRVSFFSATINEVDNNTTSVTGTGDKNLVPSLSTYTPVAGYAPDAVVGDAYGDGVTGILINMTGWHQIDAYLDVSHSNNSAHIGAAFVVNRDGVETIASRAIHGRVPNIGDIANLSGNNFVELQQGDVIYLAVASDITGDVTIHTSVFSLEYKGT